MDKIKRNHVLRIERHKRTRKKIIGTSDIPRLSVYRSNKSIYAQIIDDSIGKTIVSASSKQDKEAFKKALEKEKKVKAKVAESKIIGKIIAEKAKEKNVSKIVFDKSSYKYIGRIKAFANGAREGGLQF